MGASLVVRRATPHDPGDPSDQDEQFRERDGLREVGLESREHHDDEFACVQVVVDDDHVPAGDAVDPR